MGETVDLETVDQYDRCSESYALKWLSQEPPEDMYYLLVKHFKPGRTIDIGCGVGRDTAWLSKNGFSDVFGVDVSKGLLAIARKKYRDVRFVNSALPDLPEIDGRYQNILCETVIMHLSIEDILKSVDRLKAMLLPKGTLYLSWCFNGSQDTRSKDSRLYTFFDNKIILNKFDKEGILDFHEEKSQSSGKAVYRLIYENR